MQPVRLAFTPQSEFRYKGDTNTTPLFADVTLPISRDMYKRRIYVILASGSNFVVDTTISLLLAGQPVFQMPYRVSPSAGPGFTLRPAGGLITTTNPQGQDDLIVQFGSSTFVAHPWDVVCCADQIRVAINSQGPVTFATQFVGIQSLHLW